MKITDIKVGQIRKCGCGNGLYKIIKVYHDNESYLPMSSVDVCWFEDGDIMCYMIEGLKEDKLVKYYDTPLYRKLEGIE